MRHPAGYRTRQKGMHREQPHKQDLRAYQLLSGYEGGQLVLPPNSYLMT